MPQDRPALPRPLKREVRQRCGFGCVLCGFPIYEYDHLLGWANNPEHVARDITLLCAQHHREKTNGLLPNDLVMEANSDPWNLRSGVTKPYSLHYHGNEFKINVGGNIFHGHDYGAGTEARIIRVDGHPLLSVKLEDGHYLISLDVYDSTQETVLQIADNELTVNTHSWDIEFVGTQLIIREAHEKVIFDIKFQLPSEIVIARGRLLYNRVELFITPEWCALLNNRIFIQRITVDGDSYIGLDFGSGSSSLPSVFRFGSVLREGWDRAAAINWAREAAASGTGLRAIVDDLNAIGL